MQPKLKINRQMLFPLILTAVSAALITVSGIIFKQEIYRIIPLYISLFVGVLQMKANRFSYLLGGLNCLIYTAVFASLGLYATAASLILFSAPLQIITFWRWNKRSYKQSTTFKSLGVRGWLLISTIFAVSFFTVNFLLDSVDSSYPVMDNLSTLIGIAASVLGLLCYREYSFVMILSGAISFSLYVLLAIDDPAQITYVVYSTNSMICIVCQFFAVQALYREQRLRKKAE